MMTPEQEQELVHKYIGEMTDEVIARCKRDGVHYAIALLSLAATACRYFNIPDAAIIKSVVSTSNDGTVKVGYYDIRN